jgi:predicted RND superfamily exporter protein
MIKTLAGWTLVIITLISVLAVIYASRIGFDYDFEKFFPQGDDDLYFFLEYRERFENDNDYLLLGFQNPQGVFQEEFLHRIDSLTSYLETVPQVEQVISPTNAFRLIKGPMNWIPIPYLHLDQPERLEEDSASIYQRSQLAGQLFSDDGHSMALVIKHRQQIKRAAADSLMNSVNYSLNALDLSPVYMAGKVRAQPVYLDLIQQELVVFLSASLVLVIMLLSVAYRTFWAIVIPLLVVSLAGIWTLALMYLTGKPLDLMMVLLPTIIFVVGMSDVVHILTRYIEEIRHGNPQITALKVTFKEVGIATFLTSLTTGIGFLTLITSNIIPIRDFGIYTAAGVLIAYILAFTLLPSALVYLPSPRIAENLRIRKRWRNILTKGLIWVFRYRTRVTLVTAVLVLLAVIGMQKLNVNTFLIDDLPRSHPLKSAFLFFDQNFGGSRPFEMAIEVKPDSMGLFDYPILLEIEKVHDYLEQTYQATALTSPVSVVKSTNEALNGGASQFYSVPDAKTLNRLWPHLERFRKRSYFDHMISEDLRHSRFSGRIPDIGSNLSTEKLRQLTSFIESSVNTNLVNFRVTGTSLLIDKNNDYLVRNMSTGLAIAFGVVALIAGVMFRSWRMILITLLVNFIPLLLVAGIMGALGVTLKLTTSVIFTIAFGIAVDDTIHFISKLKMELAKGSSVLYAVKRTYFSTGKAIIITTFILISGFMTLLLSAFGGTFYIGLFVSLTLLFALIIDLTLLPVLVLWFYRPKS